MIILQKKRTIRVGGPPIEEYGKSNPKNLLLTVLCAAGAFLLGLLLSGAEAPLGTYPFVIALASSLPRGTGFAAIGII